MEKDDKEFALKMLLLAIMALGITILAEFIIETVSWVLIKMIMVESGFAYAWLWLSDYKVEE